MGGKTQLRTLQLGQLRSPLAELLLDAEYWNESLTLYPLPFSWVFDRPTAFRRGGGQAHDHVRDGAGVVC